MINLDYIRKNCMKCSFLMYENGKFLYKENFDYNDNDNLRVWCDEQMLKMNTSDKEMFMLMFCTIVCDEKEVDTNKNFKKISSCVINSQGNIPMTKEKTTDILEKANNASLEPHEMVTDFDNKVFK